MNALYDQVPADHLLRQTTASRLQRGDGTLSRADFTWAQGVTYFCRKVGDPANRHLYRLRRRRLDLEGRVHLVKAYDPAGREAKLLVQTDDGSILSHSEVRHEPRTARD